MDGWVGLRAIGCWAEGQQLDDAGYTPVTGEVECNAAVLLLSAHRTTTGVLTTPCPLLTAHLHRLTGLILSSTDRILQRLLLGLVLPALCLQLADGVVNLLLMMGVAS